MSDIKNFYNLLKYDSDKCTNCNTCVEACKYGALSFDDELKFDIDRCVGCKACVEQCCNHALYFSVNEYDDIQNGINLVPTNVDPKNTYIKDAKTKLFAEKIRLLNQIFEMIEHTNFLLKENCMDALIIFDDYKYYLQEKQKVLDLGSSNILNHFSKVKSINFFAQYVEKKLSDYSPVINLYGVPFEEKIELNKIRNLVISDTPYNSYETFSIYDLLKQYARFSKLSFDYSVEEYGQTDEIMLINKYNKIRIKKVSSLEEITEQLLDDYQFIILGTKPVFDNDINLFVDEEVNQFYKHLVKQHNDIYLRRI